MGSQSCRKISSKNSFVMTMVLKEWKERELACMSHPLTITKQYFFHCKHIIVSNMCITGNVANIINYPIWNTENISQVQFMWNQLMMLGLLSVTSSIFCCQVSGRGHIWVQNVPWHIIRFLLSHFLGVFPNSEHLTSYLISEMSRFLDPCLY